MDPGTLPQWITAVGALLAFGWALFLYRQSILAQRESAARSVYPVRLAERNVAANTPVTFGDDVHDIFVHSDTPREAYVVETPVPSNPMRVTIVPTEVIRTITATAVNGSDEVISKVRFEIASVGGRILREFDEEVSHINPSKSTTVALLIPQYRSKDGEPYTLVGTTIGITFTDSSGRRWRRVAEWPVEESEDPYWSGWRPRSLRGDLQRARHWASMRARRLGRYVWPVRTKRK